MTGPIEDPRVRCNTVNKAYSSERKTACENTAYGQAKKSAKRDRQFVWQRKALASLRRCHQECVKESPSNRRWCVRVSLWNGGRTRWGWEGRGCGAHKARATRTDAEDRRIGAHVCMGAGGRGASEKGWRKRKPAVLWRPDGGPYNATAHRRRSGTQRESRCTRHGVEWRRDCDELRLPADRVRSARGVVRVTPARIRWTRPGTRNRPVCRQNPSKQSTTQDHPSFPARATAHTNRPPPARSSREEMVSHRRPCGARHGRGTMAAGLPSPSRETAAPKTPPSSLPTRGGGPHTMHIPESGYRERFLSNR